MAFLTIDGVEVEVLQDSGEEEIIEIGDQGRAFDGTFLQRVIAVKREWSLSTLLTHEDWQSVRTTTLFPGQKTVSGTIVNDISTTCSLSVEKASPIADNTDVIWIIHFKLFEV